MRYGIYSKEAGLLLRQGVCSGRAVHLQPHNGDAEFIVGYPRGTRPKRRVPPIHMPHSTSSDHNGVSQ